MTVTSRTHQMLKQFPMLTAEQARELARIHRRNSRRGDAWFPMEITVNTPNPDIGRPIREGDVDAAVWEGRGRHRHCKYHMRGPLDIQIPLLDNATRAGGYPANTGNCQVVARVMSQLPVSG